MAHNSQQLSIAGVFPDDGSMDEARPEIHFYP